MLPVAKILSANAKRLLPSGEPGGREKLAERIGIGDKTLGFIRGGNGNPTLESIDAVARFLRVPVWQLLKPEDDAPDSSPLAWSTVSPSHSRLAAALQQSAPRLSASAAAAIEALVRELTASAPNETDHRARATAKVAAMFFKRGNAPEGPLFHKAVAELEAAYRRNDAMDQADGLIDGILNSLSTNDERA